MDYHPIHIICRAVWIDYIHHGRRCDEEKILAPLLRDRQRALNPSICLAITDPQLDQAEWRK